MLSFLNNMRTINVSPMNDAVSLLTTQYHLPQMWKTSKVVSGKKTKIDDMWHSVRYVHQNIMSFKFVVWEMSKCS